MAKKNQLKLVKKGLVENQQKRSRKKRKNKMSKKFIIGIGLISLAVVLVGNSVFGGIGLTSDKKATGESFDLVGSRSGTTTTPVAFDGNNTTTGLSSTSTYPFVLGSITDTATFNFQVSSSTSAGGFAPSVSFNVLASNDWNCGTASTTNYLNMPTEDQINWYDVGNHYLGTSVTKAESIALNSGTTTFVWWPTEVVGTTGKSVTFTNLNTKCLAVELYASSTAVYVNVMTKGKY